MLGEAEMDMSHAKVLVAGAVVGAVVGAALLGPILRRLCYDAA